MALEEQIILALFIILGALIGLLYGVRRILIMERQLLKLTNSIYNVEKKILGRCFQPSKECLNKLSKKPKKKK